MNFTTTFSIPKSDISINKSTMDRSLDEILAERQASKGGRSSRGPRSRGNGGGSRRNNDRRDDFPRDGVRKAYRDDNRKLDDEWVHDRYDESSSRQPRRSRGGRDADSEPTRGTRLRVDNLHYDLTESDLTELFENIGPIAKFELKYDNAGRSDGTAFVTYESHSDAKEAIKQYDGANAKGQPIRLTMLSGAGPRGGRVGTGRPLADRISRPRSQSPRRDRDRELRDMEDEAERRGIDRYIPGGNRNSRSYSPAPRQRREGGRRPGDRRRGDGQRRGDGGRDGGGEGRGPRTGRDGRIRKTQEELDAEMADYFVGGNNGAADASGAANGDDVDMIE